MKFLVAFLITVASFSSFSQKLNKGEGVFYFDENINGVAYGIVVNAFPASNSYHVYPAGCVEENNCTDEDLHRLVRKGSRSTVSSAPLGKSFTTHGVRIGKKSGRVMIQRDTDGNDINTAELEGDVVAFFAKQKLDDENYMAFGGGSYQLVVIKISKKFHPEYSNGSHGRYVVVTTDDLLGLDHDKR